MKIIDSADHTPGCNNSAQKLSQVKEDQILETQNKSSFQDASTDDEQQARGMDIEETTPVGNKNMQSVKKNAQQSADSEEESPKPFAKEIAVSAIKIAKVEVNLNSIAETVSKHKTKADILNLGPESSPVEYVAEHHTAASRNRYDIGMQSEHLMKHLMQLDQCLSYGDNDIRSKRKVLVQRIKKIMAEADALCKAWTSRVHEFEKLKEAGAIAENNSEVSETDNLYSVGNQNENTDSESDEDTTMEMSSCPSTVAECGNKETSDIESDSESSVVNHQECSSPNSNSNDRTANSSAPKSKSTVPSELPRWQPRVQMYQDRSHVCVAMRLPGVKIDDLDMKIDGDNLVVQGVKEPSMRDIIAYRRGAPASFGNLDIKIALPVNDIHIEGVTASIENAVLKVKFPKRMYRPRQQYPFQRQPQRYQRQRTNPYRQRNSQWGFRNPFSGFW